MPLIAEATPRMRILVVEDVQETRSVIEGLLKRDGYRVEGARDEDDAVERSRWRTPDLILISLGGAAGELIATAQRIRARAELTDMTPVVIFSMCFLPEGTEQEVAENIYGTQPDNFDQLRRLIKRVLDDVSRRE